MPTLRRTFKHFAVIEQFGINAIIIMCVCVYRIIVLTLNKNNISVKVIKRAKLIINIINFLSIK